MQNLAETYANAPSMPLGFPVTFSFSLPRKAEGPVDLEIFALASDGRTIGNASLANLAVRRGKTLQVEAFLRCSGGCPGNPPDAGLTPDSGIIADEANCGNGKVDPAETCDVAVSAGLPGACPANDCSDGLSCTRDVKLGSGCTVVCEHIEIGDFRPGDGCCPANGTHALDEDCSATCGDGVVNPMEACDTAIAVNTPGACPSGASCGDANACTHDRLISANTCSARCAHQVITTATTGDGCCPSLAAAGIDGDCVAVCGNGIKEPSETCDVGIPAGRSNACPRDCDDGNACSSDRLEGAGCQARCVFAPVTDLVAGDGCCPAGATARVDPDCPATCGDGIVEPNETCDKSVPSGQPGACPVACTASLDACLVNKASGQAATCTAVCETSPVSACAASSDGCCPKGCMASNDPDCSNTCGNGQLDVGETCDTQAPAGSQAACPLVCDDQDPCTDDVLLSMGTCHARCVSVPISAFRSGDMCCPPGANRAVDADCEPVCGNGVVELPRESCDKTIAQGQPGACVAACLPGPVCTLARATGRAQDCTARCEFEATTACANNDGCCPAGCTANSDSDCAPLCGNALLEPGEACDRGITAGNPGACEYACDDGKSCTTNLTTGSVENCTRQCSFNPITACSGGDGCCPVGCSFATDPDCAPICGNGTLEDDETCDPPASCPTSCRDEGDACTSAKLVGDPGLCTARCTQVPILECSAMSDQCCASSCAAPASDPDCRATSGATQLMSMPL